MIKPTCLEAKHQIGDLFEEAEGCQTELDEVLEGFKAGDEAMRGRVDGVLQVKLKAFQAENNNDRQKIPLTIMHQLSTNGQTANTLVCIKASALIRKEVKQLKKQMKEEVEQVKNLLDHIIDHPAQEKV